MTVSPCGTESSLVLPLLYVASVVLIDPDNRILIQQRPAGKEMAGLWEFPGGKIEAGESPESCLIREMREELGIESWKTCLAPFTFASYEYPKKQLLMLLYLCRKWQGFATARENQQLKWVYPTELSHYEMPAANSSLVAMLRDFL